MSAIEREARSEPSWDAETLHLLLVGLAVWVLGGVASFAVLSRFGEESGYSSAALRGASLFVGFALGALALLAAGTLRVLRSAAGAGALAAAVGFFLLPPALETAWTVAVRSHQLSLAPGLLALLAGHVTLATLRAHRAGRAVDRVLIPETALLFLALGLASFAS